MVRGNKFKPKAAAAAIDTDCGTVQPEVADLRHLGPEAWNRLPPKDGSLGLALAGGRSCGNGAKEAPDPVLSARHSRAGLNGGARLAGADGRGAKHRLAKGAGLWAAPAACMSVPDLLRKAVQSKSLGACAGAAAAAPTASADVAAPAHPARPGPNSVKADAGSAPKRKRQTGHAPASARAAERLDPRPRPGGAKAPARKQRRGAPGLAELAVRSWAGESAQTQPGAQNGMLARPAPALAAVNTEVQPPGATGEASTWCYPYTCGNNFKLWMRTSLCSMNVTAVWYT